MGITYIDFSSKKQAIPIKGIGGSWGQKTDILHALICYSLGSHGSKMVWLSSQKFIELIL